MDNDEWLVLTFNKILKVADLMLTNKILGSENIPAQSSLRDHSQLPLHDNRLPPKMLKSALRFLYSKSNQQEVFGPLCFTSD